MIRRRVVVHGRVQGVGFRYSCQYRASELGVHGWVRNRDDGAVEAVFEGEDDAVQRMIGWARVGPRYSGVTRIEVTEEAPKGENRFQIVY